MPPISIIFKLRKPQKRLKNQTKQLRVVVQNDHP
jgi:hypothetical protein